MRASRMRWPMYSSCCVGLAALRLFFMRHPVVVADKAARGIASHVLMHPNLPALAERAEHVLFVRAPIVLAEHRQRLAPVTPPVLANRPAAPMHGSQSSADGLAIEPHRHGQRDGLMVE